MTGQRTTGRTKASAIRWIVLGALLCRIAAALVLGDTASGLSGAHDEITYSTLGARVASGHGLTFPQGWYPWIAADAPQSYFSATFSLALGAIYRAVGPHPLAARLVMAVFSTALVFVLYAVARTLFEPRVALTSAAIASVYAYLVFYGVALVTETPFTLAVLTAIWLTHRMRRRPSVALALALGATLAVAILLRVAVVFFVIALLAWLASTLRGRERWYSIVIPLACIAVAVLPFTIRNYGLWGRFLLLESQFGHVFWNGNHPSHHGHFSNQVFPIPPEILALQNDAAITNRLLLLGIQNVWQDPRHFVELTLDRTAIFFSCLPSRGSNTTENLLRMASFGWVFPTAVVGTWISRHAWRALLPVYLLIVLHTGVHLVTWSMVRYRVPLDPLFIMFSAVTLVGLWDRAIVPRRAGNAEPSRVDVAAGTRGGRRELVRPDPS